MEQVRAVADQPVDAELQQLGHRRGVVDGVGDHLEAGGVQRGDVDDVARSGVETRAGGWVEPERVVVGRVAVVEQVGVR
jgi:hypothetical protein